MPWRFIPDKSLSICTAPRWPWTPSMAAKNLASFSIRAICTGRALIQWNFCGGFPSALFTFTCGARGLGSKAGPGGLERDLALGVHAPAVGFADPRLGG